MWERAATYQDWTTTEGLLKVSRPALRLNGEDNAWTETLDLVDRTSPYALTGGAFARERGALVEATQALRHAAGNFYLNDKPIRLRENT